MTVGVQQCQADLFKGSDFVGERGMGARLGASEAPGRIFDAVLDAARAAGTLSRRRVLDSAPVHDAVATQNRTRSQNHYTICEWTL